MFLTSLAAAQENLCATVCVIKGASIKYQHCSAHLHHKKEREKKKKRGYPFQHLSHAGEVDAEFSEPEHHSGTGTGRHLGISKQTITNIAQEELTLKTLSECVCVYKYIKHE